MEGIVFEGLDSQRGGALKTSGREPTTTVAISTLSGVKIFEDLNTRKLKDGCPLTRRVYMRR